MVKVVFTNLLLTRSEINVVFVNIYYSIAMNYPVDCYPPFH